MATRREFAAGLAASAFGAGGGDLAAGIETTTLIRREDYGKTWFHPRACVIPGEPPRLLMTMQEITGSDYFHPVHWMESGDGGRTWTKPQPVPGMGRRTHPDGLEEGVCDVVPEHHARTGAVIALGHNVYYRGGKLTMPAEKRWPVYAIRNRKGEWGPLRKLDWGDPGATAIYTSNCSQRITLADGSILIPLTYGPLGRQHRDVCSTLCRFDGEQLRIVARGNTLSLPVKRGLLEPSLASRRRNDFWMTIRAEDGHGYVARSRDGLEWGPMKPWAWTDGTPIAMSTTQQHFLVHSDGLYLVYTRKADSNQRVMRWRTPLWMARIDEDRAALIKETERVVFPQRGDGGASGLDAWLSGNFHTTMLSAGESLITDGQANPARGYIGEVLLARVRWSTPNRLAPK